jgi:hypothetical protein
MNTTLPSALQLPPPASEINPSQSTFALDNNNDSLKRFDEEAHGHFADRHPRKSDMRGSTRSINFGSKYPKRFS